MKKILLLALGLSIAASSAVAGSIVSSAPVVLAKSAACGIAIKTQTFNIGSVHDTDTISLPETEVYIECDNAVPYSISAASGTNITIPAESYNGNLSLSYFSDAGHTSNIGSTPLADTGNGAVKTHTLYPRLWLGVGSAWHCVSIAGSGKYSCNAGTYTGSTTFTVTF